MRTLHVIGIGPGSAEHLTLAAVDAMAATDVFLLLGKQGHADELTDTREGFARRFGRADARVVRRPDVQRDRTDPDYRGAVQRWRRERVDLYEQLLRDEVPEDGVGALLVWGDPALYDGTITSLHEVAERGAVAFTWDVIPGISSVAALTAAHRIPLNRVGGTVLVTPARQVADGELPDGVDDVVVMLDAHDTYDALGRAQPADVYWGAYVGSEDELLVSGALPDAGERIRRVRAEARERKGWIMDTYLVRPRRDDTD